MSSPWRILGIPKSADRREVRRAYAAKLKKTHPEDDPAGFMRLREAYEAANAWLDREEQQAAWQAAVAEREAVPASDRVPAGAEAERPLPDQPEPQPEQAALAERQAIDADIFSLEARMNALGFALAGDGPHDDGASVAAFDALVAEPAMERIDFRSQAEHWLAELMADSIPRSDAILRQAIAVFGWDLLTDPRRVPPAVGNVLARLEEWTLIESIGKSQHPYHRAFRLLSEPRPLWWRRIDALDGKLCKRIAEVIALADYEAPGLMHSLDPDMLDWWRARVQRAVGPTRRLIVPVIGVVLAVIFGALLAPGPRWLTIAVAVWPVLVTVALYLFARRFARLAARIATASVWLREGWVIAVLAWPILVLALPPTPWAVAFAAMATTVPLVWMLAARGEAPPTETSNPLGIVFVAGVFGIAGTMAAATFDWPQQALLAIAALFTLAVRWLAIGAIADLFRWRLTGAARWLPRGVVVALAITPVFVETLPGAPPPFVLFSSVIASAMLIAAASFRAGTGGAMEYWLVRSAMAIAFLIMVFGTLGSLAAERTENVPTAAEALIAAYRPNAQGEGDFVGPARAALDGLQLHAPQHADTLRPLLDEAIIPFPSPDNEEKLQAGIGRIFAERMADMPNGLIGEEFRLRIAIFSHLLDVDPDLCAAGKPHYSYGAVPDLDRRTTFLTLKVLGHAPASEAERSLGDPITQRSVDERAKRTPFPIGDDPVSQCRKRLSEMRILSGFGTDDLAQTLRRAAR